MLLIDAPGVPQEDVQQLCTKHEIVDRGEWFVDTVHVSKSGESFKLWIDRMKADYYQTLLGKRQSA